MQQPSNSIRINLSCRIKIQMVAILTAISITSCNAGENLELVADGASSYKIVIPAEPSGQEKKAGEELQFYLEAVSGCRLPLVNDSVPPGSHEILIGENRHLEFLGIKRSPDKLEKDGFHILTQGPHLVLYGAGGKGSLYGVYTFLEKYLGCRLYAPGVEYIPRKTAITLEPIDDLQNPAFQTRYINFPAMNDQKFCDWHKFHSRADRESDWGLWVHTFRKLVPPEEYFSGHPEYFSEIKGTRINDGQLCLSHPDIPGLLSANLRKEVEKKPADKFWSVSQNDNYLACECDECRKLIDMYKGESGPVLQVVNQVAAGFPEKVISTLAYQYSRGAPKKIRPAGNVNIMLCTIECNRSLPIEDDPTSESFVDDLKDWSKLTQNILLWDYVVQFRNYVSPFPNLHVLQPNIRFFRNRGIEMMFQQGSGNDPSEFHELRTYLIAKLLWNPDLDFDATMDEFLSGYYGPAGLYIREYIDALHDELEISGENLSIYGYPHDGISSYLSPVMLELYSMIFDKAEKAVDYDYTLLERVIKARLPLDFAFVDNAIYSVEPGLSYFKEENGEVSVNTEMSRRLVRFVETASAAGIKRLQEQGTTPEEYLMKVENFVSTSMRNPLGFNKQVIAVTEPSERFGGGNAGALTDGLRGLADYNYNWIGYQGEDLEVVIDLEERENISFIEARFLQYTRSWIFLPGKVEYWGSDDGEDFELIETVHNPVPADRPGIVTYSFMSQPSNANVRYLKVIARSPGKCPEWHIGAGEPCWIFVDEVVVE